jgi:hypothetical protein
MSYKALMNQKEGRVKTVDIPAFIAEFRRLMTLVGDKSHSDLKSDFISCMMKEAKLYLLNKELDQGSLEDLIVSAANYSSRQAAYSGQGVSSSAAATGGYGFKSNARQYNAPAQYYQHQSSPATDMDLSVISKENLPTFEGVDEAKVADNFEKGLCLYCGKDNHFVGVCRSLIRDLPQHPAIQTQQGNGGRGGRGSGNRGRGRGRGGRFPPPRNQQ